MGITLLCGPHVVPHGRKGEMAQMVARLAARWLLPQAQFLTHVLTLSQAQGPSLHVPQGQVSIDLEAAVTSSACVPFGLDPWEVTLEPATPQLSP